MWTDGWTNGQKGQTDRQTNGRNYTNFERNLAMMGSMSLSSMKPIAQTVFELESGNENLADRRMDRQTDTKRTNKLTELHQFRKEPSYDGDLCPFQV